MLSRRHFLAAAVACPVCARFGSADEKSPPPTDYRLDRFKTLNDYFPFVVPKTKEEWAKRRERIREQMLVANGLWPMPTKPPLDATRLYGDFSFGRRAVIAARFVVGATAAPDESAFVPAYLAFQLDARLAGNPTRAWMGTLAISGWILGWVLVLIALTALARHDLAPRNSTGHSQRATPRS